MFIFYYDFSVHDFAIIQFVLKFFFNGSLNLFTAIDS